MKLLTLIALLWLCAGCKIESTDAKLNRLAMVSATKGFEAGASGESYESFTNRFWKAITAP